MERHHRYLTVVVDHDSRRLIWAAPGRDKPTLRRFCHVFAVTGEPGKEALDRWLSWAASAETWVIWLARSAAT